MDAKTKLQEIRSIIDSLKDYVSKNKSDGPEFKEKKWDRSEWEYRPWSYLDIYTEEACEDIRKLDKLQEEFFAVSNNFRDMLYMWLPSSAPGKC